MILFSALLSKSAPLRISAPFEGFFVNKGFYSNKTPPYFNEDP